MTSRDPAAMSSDLALSSDLDDQKAELRKVQTAIRKAASVDAGAVAAAMADCAADIRIAFGLADGDIVAGYWPIKTELDPRPLMAALTAGGMAGALPATPTPGEPLVFHRWQEGDEVIAGLYGTSEPRSDAPVCAPTLVLVPMLAFDDDGFRLGYGGGFYDRSLAQLRDAGHTVHALGIAYDSQWVAEVPIGPHDARLDGVLTGSGLFLPQEGGGH
ncbi:MAG: 5-formyltetrahydrofolate cyclo-ligase [Alphaproteobacteria bacterium]|nr:5-formyltetrahydrofolate cyclo-ligase [Alphaproteobacteria bacterium]